MDPEHDDDVAPEVPEGSEIETEEYPIDEDLDESDTRGDIEGPGRDESTPPSDVDDHDDSI